jgi:hypothetical protein
MTTVSEIIEALSKFPMDAEIECGYEVIKHWETYMEHGPVDVTDFTVCDYTSESNAKNHPKMAGRFIVIINAVQE